MLAKRMINTRQTTHKDQKQKLYPPYTTQSNRKRQLHLKEIPAALQSEIYENNYNYDDEEKIVIQYYYSFVPSCLLFSFIVCFISCVCLNA
jgi:hypothetical protein